MLRIFISMFALVFTVQVSWAVASSYCMHETGNSAQHFGHHDHQHKADTDTSQLSKNKLVECDNDCDFCHHSFTNILSTQNFDFAIPETASLIETLPPEYQSYIPDGLIKPNWHRQG